MDASTPVAIVLIGSFAVDRIVCGSLFLLSDSKRFQHRFPDPDEIKDEHKKAQAERKRKKSYFFLAALLSTPVVLFAHIRLFPLVGISEAAAGWRHVVQEAMDVALTSVLFIGGADRIAELLKKKPEGSGLEKHEGTIEVVGTLTVADEKKPGESKPKCSSCGSELEVGSGYCGHCGTPAPRVAHA